MQNLKILVNSEAEAEEVKRLAVKAGYKLDPLFGKKWNAEFCYLLLCEDMSAGFANEIMADGDKPLSIGELRDMVVLKRNDVSDATHTDQDNWSWYISSNGDGYVWQCGNSQQLKQWDKASLNFVDLKPIEKNMKEYLIPSANYKYQKAYPITSWREWIEIPEGAEWAKLWDKGESYECVEFYRGENEFFNNSSKKWMLGADQSTNEIGKPATIIWNRQSLNSAETLHGTVKAEPDFNFGAAQARGGVDATLAERQTQYGCYEDVAHVTQQILSALRIGNYDELPAPMKESLHMIASKMARIVNGDPEYLDNWHDIGGYSKLIEKLIKGE